MNNPQGEPAAPAPVSVEAELQALTLIVQAMAPIAHDEVVRDRVMRWLVSQYGGPS